MIRDIFDYNRGVWLKAVIISDSVAYVHGYLIRYQHERDGSLSKTGFLGSVRDKEVMTVLSTKLYKAELAS